MTQTAGPGHSTVHEPLASDFHSARKIAPDPEWYKRAVFYEVLVRAFADSNGDGTGDLRGLIDRLDYLAWLGVDCLWLPPFYDSPLRDGGYDISDYRKVLPGVRQRRGLRGAAGRGTRPRHQGHHRPGA